MRVVIATSLIGRHARGQYTRWAASSPTGFVDIFAEGEVAVVTDHSAWLLQADDTLIEVNLRGMTVFPEELERPPSPQGPYR